MDSLAFTARERRYRMVAIRGHIWGTCMSWRPKREGSEAACMGQSALTARFTFVIAVWRAKEAESHCAKYWE